jgi:FAD/FMN-containing dehydrogenase
MTNRLFSGFPQDSGTCSNFGIVTKAGIWLMPAPASHHAFMLELRNDRNLPTTIDAIRRLALHGVMHSAIHGGKAVEDTREFQNLVNRIKTALDSHNILAPGRYGMGITGCDKP